MRSDDFSMSTIAKTPSKMKRIFLSIIGICFIFSGPAFATDISINDTKDVALQTQVSGQVTDGSGEPLIGVTVAVKGKQQGTVTNIDGQYSLNIDSDNDVLLFSYVGYANKEEAVKGRTVINVTMIEDSKVLGEVVVTALGIKRESKQLGYAMQELKGDKLVESRESNVLNALSGKVAGLQVMRSGNGMGGSTKIVLRGSNSLTGSNQPLIIIDGVPMSNFTGGVDDPYGNNGRDMGSGLGDIDQDNIASMSVLKGASAAALYGARAGNGVILITTKTGVERPGVGITVSSGLSVETAFIKPKLQTSFAQGSDGVYDATSKLSWGPKIEGQTEQNWAGENTPLRSYDNYNAFFRPGVSYNEVVTFQQNISGVAVFASVNRSDEQNTTPEAKLTKTGFNVRATTFLDKEQKWNIDAKANYIITDAKNRPLLGINSSNAYMTVYTMPTNVDLKYFKHNMYQANGDMLWWQKREASSQENPYWASKNRNNTDTRNRLLGSMSLKYKPTEWIDLQINAGTDYYSTKIYEKANAGSPTTDNGTYAQETASFYENNYSFLARATKDNLIDKLGAIFTFGGNLMFQNETKVKSEAGKLVIPNYFNLNNGMDAAIIKAENINRRMNSLYGVLNLSWDSYLYFDVTGRNDWTSTLSKANRSFFYPSFNLAYLPTEMLNKYDITYPEWLTFLKLRGSYAIVGNDLDPYQLYNTYRMEKNPFGFPTIKPDDTKYDPNVRSELIKSWEFGLDTRILNGRVGLDFTWYKKNATRQLIKIPLNPFSGYKNKIVNAGNIQNEGIEFAISADIIEHAGDGFKWDASFNFSRNKDKIIDLYGDIEIYPLTTRSLENIDIVAQVGGDYGAIYGKKYLRVTDKNSPYYGQKIVDAQGLPLFTTNNEYLGNQAPKAMMGITNNFSYKGFNMSFLVDARFGGKIFSGTTAILNNYGTGVQTVVNGERERFVLPNSVVANSDGTYTANDNSISHQQYWNRLRDEKNFGLGEQYTYDATNIRLRNISVGYTFTKHQLAKTPIQSLKLSATCNNVWMIHSKLDGIDPESVSGTNTNAIGFEANGAPSMRTFVFNLTVGF